jgi:hypothetical protein
MTMSGTMTAAMPAPVNPWMMETGSLIFWPVIFFACALWMLRTKRIPLMMLVLIAATSSFWQEFFGDWGAYVAWNPHFARLPFWGDMPFTTPVKPLFIPFSWGWWFAVSITPLVVLVAWAGKRWPNLSSTVLAFLIAFPLYCAYQSSVEGSAVAQGWWTYDSVIGPAIQSEKGNLPLLFPVLLGVWATGFVALLARKDEAGLWWHERKMGVAAKAPGLSRELARLWAFIILFQVTFLLVNTLPAIVGRLIVGGPSLLVP